MLHYLRKETKTTMSYYSVHDGLLFKSYLPGLFRKITFRDQLVVPETLAGFILHAYQGTVLCRGHLATHSDRPPTKTSRKYWWLTVSRDVRNWCEQSLSTTKNSKQQTETPDRPLTCRATFQSKHRLTL